MQMRPEIQITSVIKAVKDVVIPAIDPSNKLAIEQSQLIIGLLSLLASQLPVQFRFDRDELTRLLSTAETLREIGLTDQSSASAMERLATSQTAAARVLEGCQLDPAELVNSVRELREIVGSIITEINRTDNIEAQLRVEKIVLDMSKEQLLRDRSLMKLQAWEPDPTAVPDIEKLLA